VIANKIDLD
jgi:GTPase SAR1 family protein